MKFAKELDQDLVPEWRIKYLDYKGGKKKIKAVSRAFSRAPPTPANGKSNRDVHPNSARPDIPQQTATSPFSFSAIRRWSHSQSQIPDEVAVMRGNSVRSTTKLPSGRAIPTSRNERDGLTSAPNDMHYGSFGLTPPLSTTPTHSDRHNTFELPAPAIKVPSNNSEHLALPQEARHHFPAARQLQRSASAAPTPSSGDIPARRPQTGTGNPGVPQHATIGPDSTPHRGSLRRMLSHAMPKNRGQRSTPDIVLQVMAMDVYRQKEREFFDFLASELDKVESFYKMKEDQAGNRLAVLKEQLREMRNRRAHELNEERRRRKQGDHDGMALENGHRIGDHGYLDQVKHKIFKPGPNSRALSRMAQTPVIGAVNGPDDRRDYSRRPEHDQVSYKTAKRKLKLALQEFYRGLELLKSYALLNRTAFRKLNKKYDKAVNARPPYRFMTEKVNKAWFVNSDALEGHIKTVEDMYAQYFERGNHKIAAGKLKSLTKRRGDESGSAFRSGILIGTGVVFAVQGLTFAAQLLIHEEDRVREETSFLMQIYGGYFLMLFLFGLFVLNCWMWTENKVNYPFIFEFDQRHHLDWRQLAEFPSFFLLLLGVFIWLNFSRYGSDAVFLYYPVVLIGITALIILFPARVLAPSSRKWFAYAHWRLLLAGFYPVEFRDFFLGDIYCSLTYAVCNVSLFFCLYANHWDNPTQCNSGHSRLLGFFGALPPIWRFLQCLRRYKDTRNIFPHLVNGGKYTMSILTAVTLSIYRINGTRTNLAAFIVFATINGFYTAVWDLFMDFSLLQPNSRHKFLRDITALKKRWIYYAIMVLDPILRFAWIFYAIFTHDRQHSTVVSFLVAFAEVFRRGIWTLLRVENEHCANVAVYKASRDVPLPYSLTPLVERPSSEEGGNSPELHGAGATTTGVQPVSSRRDEEAGGGEGEEAASTGTVVRRRRTTVTQEPSSGGRSISKMLAEAHRQDFVKRRQPGEQDVTGLDRDGRGAQSDDDLDDEEECDVEDEEGDREDEVDVQRARGLAEGSNR
ncbi:hypothetical protein ACHAQH_009706 [Verticillium albo-atrum]